MINNIRTAFAVRLEQSVIKPYYEDDSVILYHGDSLDILPHIKNIDAVVTDPPYSSGGMYRSDRSRSTAQKYQIMKETTRTYAAFSGDNRDQRSFEKWVAWWAKQCLECVNDSGGLISFMDWRNLTSLIDAIQVAGWTYAGLTPWHKGTDLRPIKGWFRLNVEYIIWATKGAIRKGATAEGNCWDGIFYHRINGKKKLHQTGKPLELIGDVLKIRPEWNVFLDPFAGSGTTLFAAKMLGKKAIGIEIEENNCEIIANRLRQDVLAL